jgi:RNA polymerase sigma factor (sigma-70 family)
MMEREGALRRGKGMHLTSRHPVEPALAPMPPPPDIRARPDPGLLTSYTGTAQADFDAFYRRCRPDIARGLALSLGDLELAVEATDEALTRAYARWKVVSRLDRPEAWVYRVAWNWAVSVFRGRRRSLHRLYERDRADTAVPDPAIHAAISRLDVKHRSVVVCRHFLGWSVADTAAALDISEGTVKSRLHRATTQLRAHLRDFDPTADKEPS